MKKKYFIVLLLIISSRLPAQSWQPLGCGVTGQPGYSLYNDTSSGKLFVVGEFTRAGCYDDDGVAAWNGTSWDTIYNLHGGGSISPITFTKYQNQLYCAGGFNHANGRRVNGFTRWNGSNWDSINIAFHGIVADPEQFCVHNDTLYIVGGIDSVGSYRSPLVTAWDGINWIPMGIPNLTFGEAFACVFFQNEFYVGGHFGDSLNTIHDLVKWDGTSWHQVGTTNVYQPGSIQGFIKCLGVYNNELYIGGQFVNTFPYIYPGQALLKYDGTNFTQVGGGIKGNWSVMNLKVIDNKLFIVGSFDSVGNIPTSGIAVWDGTNLSSFCNDLGNSIITDITVFNNELYITGGISLNSDTSIHNVAKYQGWYLGENDLKKKEAIVEVFPNPASSSISIHHTQVGTGSYEFGITDVYGRVVYQEACPTQDTKIEVLHWSAGVYFYELRSPHQTTRGKFVVQH